jgi:hypothetical protein
VEVSNFGDASGFPISTSTMSERRINFRESDAKRLEFETLPEVRVIIMVPSVDFLLQDVIKRLAMPMAIIKQKTMVALNLFIKGCFKVL